MTNQLDSLGDRMKEYESVTKNKLIRRMPAIIRLDGRAFHTLTRRMDRPFDKNFYECMAWTAVQIFEQIQTGVFIYFQSDEISILLKDYSKLESQSWFGGQIQKIVSIAAATATLKFNQIFRSEFPNEQEGMFDARVFNLPKEDVVNYFVWRQKDATRNSINALGQEHFSHTELQNKSQEEVVDMLFRKDIHWAKLPTKYKRGAAITSVIEEELVAAGGQAIAQRVRYGLDEEIPIFTEDREYVSRYL